MCARLTVLSDTPIPSAIAGCVIPISRHSTIWMRSRCAGGNFQCRAVFSRRTSALLHLIICPPNQMLGSESCRARKKYCTNHTHPLSPQKSRFKRVWRRYQYVPKGAIHFDLCIIDEASQMPPESAVGALLRCSQTMVVGDTNQLPPSSFFKTLFDDDEADEDETVLNESIL